MPVPYGLYVLGTGLMRLLPAAARGIRTFRAARAARAMEPTQFQRIGAQLGRGERKLFKKSPLTAGGIETALSAPIAAEGLQDVGQGAMSGDYGQVASGLGGLALGVPFLGRGLRMTGASKNIGKLGEPLRTTGRTIQQKTPKGTLPAGLALTGVGLATEGDAKAEEKVLGDPVEFVVKQIEEYKKNPNIDTESDEFKRQASLALRDAYLAAGEQGIEQEQSFEELVAPYAIKSEAPGSEAVVVDESKISSKGLHDDEQMTDEEIRAGAIKQENEAAAGKKLKDKFDKSATAQEAEQFNRFYERIQNLTGGNDQTNNLILMKLASGLLSGKTGQTGLRGFLDVAGQAGTDAIDTAMALYSREKDRRNDLAVAFLKSKTKQSSGRAVTGKRVSVQVADPNTPFGISNKQIDYFKDDGTTATFVPVYNDQGNIVGEEAVPMPYAEYEVYKKSPAQLNKQLTQLNNVGLAYQMTNQVLAMPDTAFGIRPSIMGFTEDAIGSLESIGSMFGLDIGANDAATDAKIVQDIINAPVFNRDGTERVMTEKEADEMREITEAYQKEVNGILKNVRPGEEELDQITKAKLIETRLKYIVANANKAEDRLTQKDIENAEATTRILGFKSPKAVRSAYKNLQAQLDKQFENVGRKYITLGGSNKYLVDNFTFMPYMAKYVNSVNKEAMEKAIQGQQMQILDSINMG